MSIMFIYIIVLQIIMYKKQSRGEERCDFTHNIYIYMHILNFHVWNILSYEVKTHVKLIINVYRYVAQYTWYKAIYFIYYISKWDD